MTQWASDRLGARRFGGEQRARRCHRPSGPVVPTGTVITQGRTGSSAPPQPPGPDSSGQPLAGGAASPGAASIVNSAIRRERSSLKTGLGARSESLAALAGPCLGILSGQMLLFRAFIQPGEALVR